MVSLLKASERAANKLLPDKFIRGVDQDLRSTHIAFSGSEFCGIGLIAGLEVLIAILVISIFVNLPFLPDALYAIIGFTVTFLALTKVMPFFYIRRRVRAIEKTLPDALREMSNVLRAGVSMDRALEDVAGSSYGALSEEFEYALNQVRRGRPMRDALRAMARRSRSELLSRGFYLIVEGMERGAELADVMESVADDIRETQTLQRERQAATMQQILFLLVAALFIAPLISGIVLHIGTMFEAMGTQAGGAGVIGETIPPVLYTVVPLFIAIQAFITSLAVGVIRYGEMAKGVLFSGPFMVVAVLVFYGSQTIAGFLI